VDDRRRTAVSHLLSGYGLLVQQSVFECVLDDRQYEALPKKILKYLNQNEDQLRFYPLSAHCRHNVVVLGVQPEFVVDDTAFIV